MRAKLPVGSSYLDEASAEQFVANEWQNAPGPTVVKAHQLGPATLAAIRAGHARAVCTFRDPRDCVASDLVFMGEGFEKSVIRLNTSLEILKFYQSTSNILLVKYEEMMTDRRNQVRRIATHLQIKWDEAMIKRVDSKTNIESARRVCRDLKYRPSTQYLNVSNHRVDPETHLHEQHIGRATPGRWRDELTASQARWLTEYYAPWLVQLGYETQESLRKLLAGETISDPTAAPLLPATESSQHALPSHN